MMPSLRTVIDERIERARALPHGVSAYVIMHDLQGGLCFYCSEPIDAKPHIPKHRPRGYTVDHLFPKSKGWGREGNAVLSCFDCNCAKADRCPERIDVGMARLLWSVFSYVVDQKKGRRK